jgi:hypothetical protein
MNNVQKLVYGMLTESTGKAMCDSGGTDGRMWQRNQKKTIEDFSNEDEEVYEFDYRYGDITRTVSVFHYMTNNLVLDDVCDEFNQIQEDSDNWKSDINGVSWQAYDHIDSFEDDLIKKGSWNTYNGDSDLSQTLQGAHVEVNGDDYIIIQIHNGADVRGGYTDAKLFKFGDYCDGMIHEYLSDYKDSYDINEDLEEEYVNTYLDYAEGSSKTYTAKEVKKRVAELS